MRLLRLRWLQLPTLLRHLAKSARGMAGRLFAMGSIAGFGLAVYIGGQSAIASILASRDAWYAAGHLADMELRVAADDVANLPDFRSVPGVADIRTRLILPATIRLRDEFSLRALLITADFEGAAPLNTLHIGDGRGLDPADSEGVVIEHSLAKYHGIKVGDALAISFGGESTTLQVRGVASGAEFLLAPANPLLFVPTKGSLGVLYVTPGALSARFGFVPANSILFRLAPEAVLDEVREAIVKRARTRMEVDWTTARDEQFSHRFLEKDLEVFRIIVPVIVLFCAATAAAVAGFMFLQWVANERRALAVFLALGHAHWEIATAFAVALSILAVGIVAEGFLLAPLIGRAFLTDFAEASGLPLPRFSFDLASIGWGIAGVVIVLGLAGAIAVGRVFQLSPRDAMKHGIALAAAPDPLGSVLGRLMPKIWLRMALRNLFRHRLVSTISVASVALGVGIATSFFVTYTSFIGTTMNLVEANEWDCAVDFVAPLWDEDAGDLARRAGIADHTPYVRGVAQAVKAPQRVNLQVTGFDPDKPWHAATLVAGQGLSNAQPEGMLLEQGTARSLGATVGSRLLIDMQGRQRVVFVRGLLSGATPGEARLTLAFMRELADLNERTTGMFVRSKGDPEALARTLSQDPDVQQVLTKRQAAREILAASEPVIQIVRLGEAVSLTVAALCILASVGYTVLLRRNEYQTLRVLGYQDSTITAIVASEVALLGVLSLTLATPVAAVAAGYYNRQLSLAWFRIDTILVFADFMRAYAAAFTMLLLVAISAARIAVRTPLEAGLHASEIS